jgi:hypothetical protein
MYASDVFGAREVHFHVENGAVAAAAAPGLEQLRVDVDELRDLVAGLTRSQGDADAALLGLEERQGRIYRLLERESLLPRGRRYLGVASEAPSADN